MAIVHRGVRLESEEQAGVMLDIENLHKTYQTAQGPLHVLRGVDLHLGSAESLALTGESGSGKSTLLHLAAALDRPDGGDILLDGKSIAGLSDRSRARLRRERLGLVFQQFNLIPSLKVADNLAFQARIAGRYDDKWQTALIARLGLRDLLDRYPEQLSGGQQQRVAIGRTLAGRPDLLLADEPTGNLDEETGDAVLALCLDLVREAGTAFLMVTHSERLASMLSRRVHLTSGMLS
jgi:putative ABC transport system ATP-binding protein